MWHRFCQQYNIPLLETGKLIIATNSSEENNLDYIIQHKEGIPNVQELSQQQVLKLEPHINATSGIFCPTTAVIDTAKALDVLEKLCERYGTLIAVKNKVISINPSSDKIEIYSEVNGIVSSFTTDYLVNSAGLYSDTIAKMVNPHSNYEIIPVKGEYIQFHNKQNTPISRNVYPVPWEFEHEGRKFYDLGIHLTPSSNGTMIRVGPDVYPITSKEDYKKIKQINTFLEPILKLYSHIKKGDLQFDHVGVLAEEKNNYDFIMESDQNYPHCYNLIGMESPGLTAALAIANKVVKHSKNYCN